MTSRNLLLISGLAIFVGCGGGTLPPEGGGRLVAANQRADANAPAAPGERASDRKIIYTATLELTVENLEDAEAQLKALLNSQGGYVAKSEVRGSVGTSRVGSWTVRVPVEHFDALMEAVAKLGEVVRTNLDSDDITDKFFDLQAHIKNNEVEEEGLRNLLLEKSTAGTLEDILAVRRELRAIRGEIDQQQTQIQRWEKEVALATIHLTFSDRQHYVPPTSPGLRASIGHTFHSSLEAFVAFVRGLLLIGVALLPWLPLFACVILAVSFWKRRRPQLQGPVT
jgi:hypothetical protein